MQKINTQHKINPNFRSTESQKAILETTECKDNTKRTLSTS